jgi:hypothetical protein
MACSFAAPRVGHASLRRIFAQRPKKGRVGKTDPGSARPRQERVEEEKMRVDALSSSLGRLSLLVDGRLG